MGMTIGTVDEPPILLTPEEAESLLLPGPTVHNFIPASFAIIGCDCSRKHAIETFKAAIRIEIGGPNMKGMHHPIVVWESKNKMRCYEADMEKVEAFEKARA